MPFASFPSFRSALPALAALTLLALPTQQVAAQTAASWPSKPVRIVVSFPPGGTSDIVARLVGQHLSDKLGQQFLVDNRPGAGGTLAADIVKKEAPDGYTLILANNAPFTIAPTQFKKIPYDPLKDFTHVAYIGASAPGLLVQPALGVKDLRGFVELTKKDKISYGSSGVGSISHILGEGVKKKAGIQMVHVPYKGSAPATNDLLSGQIQVQFDPTTLPHIAAGRLKCFAIASEKRWPGRLDIPTLREQGYGKMGGDAWYGILAPRGTNPAIVNKMSRAIGEAAAMPDINEKLVASGNYPSSLEALAFRETIVREAQSFGEIIKKADIKI